MKPLIFNRVVETNVIGNISPREYETTYVFEKIEISYFNKFIKKVKNFFYWLNYYLECFFS